MRITITTDGGFTGRGIGSVTVDDAELRDDLREAIANARPEQWQEDYPARGADLVRYTIDVDGRRASFNDGAAIPDDLRRLFEAVWRTRR